MTQAQRLAYESGPSKRILVEREPLQAGRPCWRIATSRGSFVVEQWYAIGAMGSRHVHGQGRWHAYLVTTAALRWS